MEIKNNNIMREEIYFIVQSMFQEKIKFYSEKEQKCRAKGAHSLANEYYDIVDELTQCANDIGVIV